jgi:hypothetical protein
MLIRKGVYRGYNSCQYFITIVVVRNDRIIYFPL